ncbi:hypothetical protein NW768_004167 [Fusarium equiseti]|uniref:Pesticidal crystal protein domain-containing protein n=1 Tax=Fusarium equiseti TaxID=61235 RepID=A0ABQ8RJP7_FUSEQ|nr:hypothetical protein NW768_004167 [Fusarium equiseti]
MLSDRLENALPKKTTHDVLDVMLVDKPETYIPNEPVGPDNVDEVAKVVISSVVGEVPILGGLLSGLLDLFWPGGKDDEWGSMRPMVEALIDDKNQQQDAKNIRDSLNGLHRRLRDYVASPDDVKIQELREFVNRTTDVVASFVNNESPWYSLPYLVRFGTLRLSALWTRWRFCKEIDKTTSSKKYYENELVNGFDELMDAVRRAKELCIDRRVGQIKKIDGWVFYYFFSVFDPHTRAKLYFAAAGGYPVSDEERKKVETELEKAIHSVYGEELDAICAPTKLWEQFLPDYVPKVRVQAHRQNRGWVWNRITPQTTSFDITPWHDKYGKLDEIRWYHIEDSYYNTRQVVGIVLFYGGLGLNIGGRRGSCTTIEIGKDEALVRARARVSNGDGLGEPDTLEVLEFTTARGIKDKEGRMRYENVKTWANGDIEAFPNRGCTITYYDHDGRDSKPYPTCMISAVGWAYNDHEEGYIGSFQPVFGCWETVTENGLSTWSFEKEASIK